MLMTPISYKKLRSVAFGYEYKTDIDTTNILKDVTTKDINLVRSTNPEILDIPPWMPPNAKIDIKLHLAPSHFILQKVVAIANDLTVSLASAILPVRKQQTMISIALVIENFRPSGNDIKPLVPHTITNQRHTAMGSCTYTDLSVRNV